MNSKKLRIVFMGTPDFAVGVLEQLVTENYNVVKVITVADKPAGRGKKLRASAVKEYANKKNIPILQPKNLKDNQFIADLKQLKADLFIVVAFRMLPKVVWELPKLGTFNLHASLLPAYRGAAPINWVLINGEKETGVTTFFIDDKIDTGEIILQEKLSITACDTAGSLHDKLMKIGANLVLKTVNLIASGAVKTTKQVQKERSKAPKLYKEDNRINWKDSLESIYNKIRGLSPYPVAWSKFVSNEEEYTVKFYHTRPEYTIHNDIIGNIISTKKTVKIVVKDGYLFLEEIQLSGKRKMDVKSLLNGFQFSKNAKML